MIVEAGGGGGLHFSTNGGLVDRETLAQGEGKGFFGELLGDLGSQSLR